MPDLSDNILWQLIRDLFELSIYGLLFIALPVVVFVTIKSATKSLWSWIKVDVFNSIRWAVLNPISFFRLVVRSLREFIVFAVFFGLGIALYLGSGFLLTLAITWGAKQIWGFETIDPYIVFILLGSQLAVLGFAYGFGGRWVKFIKQKFGKNKPQTQPSAVMADSSPKNSDNRQQ